MKRGFAIAALLILSITTIAQEVSNPFKSAYPDTLVTSEKFKAHLDSLTSFFEHGSDVINDDISDNPLYFRLFMPIVMYGSAISEAITPERKGQNRQDDLLPLEPIGDVSERTLARMIDETLAKVYLEHPELVRMTEEELMGVQTVTPISEDMVTGIQLDVKARGRRPTIESSPDMAAPRQRYWKVFGNFQGKYTQSYYSDNWYKGGESNHSILGQINTEANYARKNTTFDNKLELKLGFY